MESLPPIPTPPAQRWREFRIQVLPVLVFLVTLAAIVVMWHNFVVPSGVVGQVEAVTNNVFTAFDGTLTNLSVDRFDCVTNGQVIGVVEVVDPEVYEASLAAVPANLNVIQSRMSMNRTAAFNNYSTKRIEVLREQLALELAQKALIQAESQWRVMTNLYGQGVVSKAMSQDTLYNKVESGLDVAIRDRDKLQSEIQIRTNLVAQLEEDLKMIDKQGTAQMTPDEQVIQQAIKEQEDLLKANQKPFVLKAPMDGVVRWVNKHKGERVGRGDIILIISSAAAQRIVGYVRQPMSSLPTTSDTVLVRTRTLKRQAGEAQVLRVGTQFEPIAPILLPDPTRPAMGLPILVSLPPGLNVSPGEVVDLSIRHGGK